MYKLILFVLALVVAVWIYQNQEPECVLRFAHSDTETIPFVECDNGEIRKAKIK